MDLSDVLKDGEAVLLRVRGRNRVGCCSGFGAFEERVLPAYWYARPFGVERGGFLGNFVLDEIPFDDCVVCEWVGFSGRGTP